MRLQDWLWGKTQVSCAKFNGDEKKKKHACISCKKLLRLGPLIQKRLFHIGVETEDPVPNF